MVDKSEILARLQNGEDPQKLAETIANALNEAIVEYEQQEKQKRLEAAKAQQKINEAQKVINVTLDFLEAYYPQLVNDTVRKEVTGELLIQMIEESVKEINKINQSIKGLEDLYKDYEALQKTSKPYMTTADIDPIEKFLAEFVNN